MKIPLNDQKFQNAPSPEIQTLTQDFQFKSRYNPLDFIHDIFVIFFLLIFFCFLKISCFFLISLVLSFSNFLYLYLK